MPGASTTVSVAPVFHEDEYVVELMEVDFMFTTVDIDVAVTPIADRLLLPLIAEAIPEAMLVRVSPDNTE